MREKLAAKKKKFCFVFEASRSSDSSRGRVKFFPGPLESRSFHHRLVFTKSFFFGEELKINKINFSLSFLRARAANVQFIKKYPKSSHEFEAERVCGHFYCSPKKNHQSRVISSIMKLMDSMNRAIHRRAYDEKWKSSKIYNQREKEKRSQGREGIFLYELLNCKASGTSKHKKEGEWNVTLTRAKPSTSAWRIWI